MTASSILDIYNLALSACNAAGRVSSLTEQSRERELCEQWYESAVKTVQEAAHWPGCQVYAYLPLKATRDFSVDWVETDPVPQFTYKYGLPDNYLRAWYLTDYSRFALSFDVTDSVRVLSCDVEKAVLVYSRFQENVTQWTPQQSLATAYGLAGHIAGSLSGSNELVNKNFQLANRYLLDAQTASMSMNSMHREAIPPEIKARGYSAPEQLQQFIYPFGSLFQYSPVDV